MQKYTTQLKSLKLLLFDRKLVFKNRGSNNFIPQDEKQTLNATYIYGSLT